MTENNVAPPKRKRNRKKKSKGGDDQSKKSDGAQNPKQQGTTTDQMNPLAVLRNNLMSQGFTSGAIDKAMEEMWDKGLSYDEYEAVLKYLKSGGEEEGRVEEADNVTEETKPQEGKEYGGVEESKEEENEPPAAKVEIKPASPPMTMVAKLDMVARFENMADAIFALTEWVTKAAKPHELEELCAAEHTSALPVIFHRSITECESQAKFDTAVLPAMLRLMTGLLNKCGIPSNAVAEIQDSFELLLKQARRVFLMKQPEAESFAERVSRFVVSRISLAVDESKLAAATEGSAKPEKDEMESMTSSLASNVDQGIAELLSKREMHKTAATCASLATHSLSAPVSNGRGRETEMEKSDIFLAIAGVDAKISFEAQKANLDALKSQLREGESERVTKRRSEVDDINSERHMISQRIAELKQSIEKLETYDAELCAKVADTNAEIEAECTTESQEASRLDVEVAEASKVVKYGNSVGSLVKMLKSYDDALDKAINGTVHSSIEADVVGEGPSRKMDMFLFRARNYFVSETQCVDFLQGRIQASEKEVGELKIEIAECEGLGMNTTIGQMEEAVKGKIELIEKDRSLTGRLRAEASLMFDLLISRLEQYKSAQESGAHALIPIHAQTLQDIPTCALKLGVSNRERLDPFLVTNGARYNATSRSTDPTIASKSGTNAAPSGTPKTQAAAKEQVKTMPKFTWATTTKPVECAQKASLLEIQKEELESKGES